MGSLKLLSSSVVNFLSYLCEGESCNLLRFFLFKARGLLVKNEGRYNVFAQVVKFLS